MTITPSGEKFDLEKEVKRLTKKGIFDKAVSLDYVAVIHPFIDTREMLFNCHANNALSFKLNIEDIQDKEEEKFWKMISKGGENVKFSGHMNRLYCSGIGELKGYISSLEYQEYNRKLLVGVKKGEVKRLITERDLIVYQALTLDPTQYFDTNKSDNSNKHLDCL